MFEDHRPRAFDTVVDGKVTQVEFRADHAEHFKRRRHGSGTGPDPVESTAEPTGPAAGVTAGRRRP